MQEFYKCLIYSSFALNMLCGVWVFFGILKWINELRDK